MEHERTVRSRNAVVKLSRISLLALNKSEINICRCAMVVVRSNINVSKFFCHLLLDEEEDDDEEEEDVVAATLIFFFFGVLVVLITRSVTSTLSSSSNVAAKDANSSISLLSILRRRLDDTRDQDVDDVVVRFVFLLM